MSRKEWARSLPGSFEAGRWVFKRAHSSSEKSVGWVFLMHESVQAPSTLNSAKQALRERSIEGFSSEDVAVVERLLGDFEKVLGPVGAAKALHLLAPQFFPLWDRAIAKTYGLPLRERGKNADRYRRFIEITKQQYETLAGEHS